jgi:predicted metal-dependent hydrolase
MMRQLKLREITVDVVQKDIKNIHLSAYPPTGRVRISAPSRMREDTIRVCAVAKLAWIRQKQRKLREQERETSREYLDRERTRFPRAHRCSTMADFGEERHRRHLSKVFTFMGVGAA